MPEPGIERSEVFAVPRLPLPGPESRGAKQKHPAAHRASDQKSAADILREEAARDQRVERCQFARIGFSYVAFSTPVSKPDKQPTNDIKHCDRKVDDGSKQPSGDRKIMHGAGLIKVYFSQQRKEQPKESGEGK